MSTNETLVSPKSKESYGWLFDVRGPFEETVEGLLECIRTELEVCTAQEQCIVKHLLYRVPLKQNKNVALYGDELSSDGAELDVFYLAEDVESIEAMLSFINEFGDRVGHGD